MSAVKPKMSKYLFPLTVVLGSFLLFLTQPMIARMALPRLGGAPAVWNSAMLVYQALLLAGYAYAHLLSRTRTRTQPIVHVCLLVCASLWLPMGIGNGMLPADADPIVWTPVFLAASIGPLFLIVSSQAPLLQSWYAKDPGNGDPYPLYAASNAGSFAGLLSYPFIMEPLFTVEAQSMIWSAGYVLLAMLTLACAIVTPRNATTSIDEDRSPAPTPGQIARWIVLAAIPSGLMLSTTTYLTTDVVANPLLWVIPLAIYLLSFIVAFSSRRAAADAAVRCAPLILIVGGGFVMTNGARLPLVSVILGSLTLYIVSVAIHSELNRTKPSIDRLTGFYLYMSLGGVIGGAFCALIAPALFNWVYEHPILILASAFVIPMKALAEGRTMSARSQWSAACIAVVSALVAIMTAVDVVTGIAAAVIAIVGFLLVLKGGLRLPYVVTLSALMLTCGGWYQIGDRNTDLRTRSYFGSYRVEERNGSRVLLHGTTTHGIQRIRPVIGLTPVSYYSATSGVGRVMEVVPSVYGDHARIGVVGLGAGVLACYKKPLESWHFYEIDPEIVRIARDPHLFTYMSSCAPGAPVTIGDARLTLAADRESKYDVLVLDAFSSDAVPIHLLTRQAFEIYGRLLSRDSTIVLHISNRHVDLRSVVAATVASEGWHASILEDDGRSLRDPLVNASSWVAMSKDPETLARIMNSDKRWKTLKPSSGTRPWTDDHASIMPILRGL